MFDLDQQHGHLIGGFGVVVAVVVPGVAAARALSQGRIFCRPGSLLSLFARVDHGDDHTQRAEIENSFDRREVADRNSDYRPRSALTNDVTALVRSLKIKTSVLHVENEPVPALPCQVARNGWKRELLKHAKLNLASLGRCWRLSLAHPCPFHCQPPLLNLAFKMLRCGSLPAYTQTIAITSRDSFKNR